MRPDPLTPPNPPLPPESPTPGRPFVFAHRGASYTLPEHTLDAYRQAIDEGADGLECDVRLTRDGHLVCIHDRRLDRTSNGRGRVSAATLDELERLDFGSWQGGPDGQGGQGAPAQVLTLERLLVTALGAGRPLRLLIETKHPTRRGSQVEQRLVELLGRYGLAAADPAAAVQVTVMSFAPLALRRIRLLAPALPTVFLFEAAPPGVRDGRPPFGAQVLGPRVGALRSRPEMVDRAHARGHLVYVWTVNEPDELEMVIGLGVDGIISDRPAFVLSHLGR
jgi:glycerophosphoryl diester phosphodiesterase